MQISSRFTIAIHVLTCVVVLDGQMPMNSETIAGSVGVNPVVVRNIFRQLKKADLIVVQRGGNGGVKLARDAKDITLFDVYQAVDAVADGKLFHFHENPNAACPVGRNIHHVMDGRLREIQEAMEQQMARLTLADIIADTEAFIGKENKTA
ncbi:Rrf2 family transcriptional regulator [uncultured Selenomonas sp.]|uniref:Rrf2 family transcriptional regulator n=1 Tax=uncultured Selenomonas sp. TaxID=159275 RepID=UPI0025F16D9D|nr:Rrf2 family transcriptional regulator [uncultured Selenomonas sp.]